MTNNAMANRTHTRVVKSLHTRHRKLKIEQHESNLKLGINSEIFPNSSIE